MNSLASWDMVCKLKDKGGLGVINLHVQNRALLLKQLDKFYNNADTPWVKLIRDSYYHDTVPHAVTLSGSFWWRGIRNLMDSWRLITHCKLGSGSSVLFWEDLWHKEILAKNFHGYFRLPRISNLPSKSFFRWRIGMMGSIYLFQWKLILIILHSQQLWILPF